MADRRQFSISHGAAPKEKNGTKYPWGDGKRGKVLAFPLCRSRLVLCVLGFGRFQQEDRYEHTDNGSKEQWLEGGQITAEFVFGSA